MPSTPSGQVMDEFLEAYNTGKFSPVAAFFARHGSEDRATERAQWVMGFLYPGVRQFAPVEVLKSKPDTITVLGHSELTEAWYRFTIEVDPQPPERLDAVRQEAFAAGLGAREAGLLEERHAQAAPGELDRAGRARDAPAHHDGV